MKRVFVVEDEAVVALELKDHLRNLGYLVCGHAMRGVDALREIPEAGADLVLMDINLGPGMSGIEVATRLRERVQVPVIFLSAYADEGVTAQASATGSHCYIVKPFEPRELKANIELALVRRAAEQELRESEDRYRRLFVEAIDGIYRTDLEGRVLDANPALARLLGYPAPVDLIGRVLPEHFVDRADWLALLARRRDESEASGVEVPLRTRSGAVLWVEARGRSVVGGADDAPGYLGLVRDVTARRQEEEALRFLSTGVSGVDGRRRFDAIAARLAEIVGAEIAFIAVLSRADPDRVRKWSLVVDGVARPGGARPIAGTPGERVVRAGTLVLAEGVREGFPDDPMLDALGAEGYVASPIVGSGGEVLGYVGVVRRRRIEHPERVERVVRLFALRIGAEVERQRTEARFAGVFENAPDALVIASDDGRIVQANRSAEEVFGYPRDELLGRDVEDLVPEASRGDHRRWREGFQSSPRLRRMGTVHNQLYARRRDGASVPVEIGLSPFETEEGRLVVAAVRDVTDRVQLEEHRVRLEQQLRESQKMEALGTLAGGIAHDFNNLLAVIISNLELAQADGAVNDLVGACLDEIRVASTRAAQLVKQILAIGRRQPSRCVVTRLGAVVEEVASLLRSVIPAGIRLSARIEDGVPEVFVDPSQIHQVVMNLGTNAWQAIERPTGSLALHVDAVDVTELSRPAAGLSPGRYARLRLTDDGKGMDAATLARIFEPFFTTKGLGRGTGLGLAVVHGIIAQHGGGISVSSEVGVGTTFAVYLPEAAARQRTPSAPPPSPRRLRRGVGHVLLVEDEDSLRSIATILIELLGYRVSAFGSPVKALEALRADPLCFDAVLTDLNMPDVGGLELARAVGAIRPGLPVLLTSGDLRRDEARTDAANVRLTLEKPFLLDTLSEALASVLGARGDEDAREFS